ncbi:uncharacterized protein LOC117638908 [Thrips palmi]|uniref:Uncharacterized protein LOC117638908 n=1 Tax=Thrips palmi TaxID=161013 RepID=A0A6P8Y1A4_THRPL|nr:uncharacterized protein LOC117638908 [Thrips palmi]
MATVTSPGRAERSATERSSMEHSAMESRRDPLAVLPKEILFRITCFLSPREVLVLGQLSRAWRDFCRDAVVWEKKRVRLNFRRVPRRHLHRCGEQCDALFGPGFGPSSDDGRDSAGEDSFDDGVTTEDTSDEEASDPEAAATGAPDDQVGIIGGEGKVAAAPVGEKLVEEDAAVKDEGMEEDDEAIDEEDEEIEEEEDEEDSEVEEEESDDCSDGRCKGEGGGGDSASEYSTDDELDEGLRLRLMAYAGHLDTLLLDANWMGPAQLEAVKRSHATVRRLTIITSCYEPSMDPPWATELLRRVAPRVEELSLVPATRSMLAELRNMPRLRRLKIDDYAMRKGEDPNVELAAPSEPGTGVKWLRAYDLPRETTEALLRAYGHSLQEVLLSAGAMGGEDQWPVTCSTETLVPMMERCRLRALRRWVRCGRRCYDPCHCEKQRQALRAVLPRTCAVLCAGTSCDRYRDDCDGDFDFIF